MGDTPALDTPDSATLVATLDSDTEDTPVASTASVRLRLRPRLIPTTDTATLARGATEDTEDMVSATAVDTPPSDTPPLDTLVLATAVATPDLATVATPVLEVSTASVRS